MGLIGPSGFCGEASAATSTVAARSECPRMGFVIRGVEAAAPSGVPTDCAISTVDVLNEEDAPARSAAEIDKWQMRRRRIAESNRTSESSLNLLFSSDI